MERKYLVVILMTVFVLGAIAALPIPVKAQAVTFYVYPSVSAAKAAGTAVDIEVRIDSPSAWANTPLGIAQWAFSIRVDPRALTPSTAGKISGMVGFLEAFLVANGYDFDYSTVLTKGETDATTGTMFDITEGIVGYQTLGKGAGGSGRLCRIRFYSVSDVIPSVMDIFGPPRPAETPTIRMNAVYWTPDGVEHSAEVMTDGYYISQTPQAMYFDLVSTTFDPLAPQGSQWHEIWPTFSQKWSLESWTNNANPPLDASDQIDLVQMEGSSPGTTIWGHVDWINPTPTPNDGKADLILGVKEVPEFPLGLGILMTAVAAIPVAYLWRVRKKSR